jgi:hypothetical protein
VFKAQPTPQSPHNRNGHSDDNVYLFFHDCRRAADDGDCLLMIELCGSFVQQVNAFYHPSRNEKGRISPALLLWIVADART